MRGQAGLLLFDVDGTLLDPHSAGRTALRAAMLEVFGLTGPIDGHDFRGKTDPAIVRALLRESGWRDAEIDRRLEDLWEPYLAMLQTAVESPATRPSLCPGIPELLDRLVDEGRYELGLVTGNVIQGAEKKLHAAGLAGRFETGAYGSDSELRHELPPLAVKRASLHAGVRFRLEETTVVGDTPEDINCARVAGTHVLAVATGGYGIDELSTHEPDGLLADLSDADAVLAVLEEILAGVRGSSR
jgi:phosphoglycolate phosphatase-like HAD superfamily hydrolase